MSKKKHAYGKTNALFEQLLEYGDLGLSIQEVCDIANIPPDHQLLTTGKKVRGGSLVRPYHKGRAQFKIRLLQAVKDKLENKKADGSLLMGLLKAMNPEDFSARVKENQVMKGIDKDFATEVNLNPVVVEDNYEEEESGGEIVSTDSQK